MFENMFGRNLYSWNIMLAACARNGHLEDAKAVFAEMPRRDVVSWSAIIAACAHNGEDAIQLFEGIEPDEIAFLCVQDSSASVRGQESSRGCSRRAHNADTCKPSVDRCF